jgi:ABC-type phosphate transport system substrate-binding protein
VVSVLGIPKNSAAGGTLIGVLGALVMIGLQGRLPPAGAAATGQTGGPLAFIVNKANPVDNLSFQDLRKLFLSERTRWPNGKSVTLVMQDEGQADREVLLHDLYHMTEVDYHRQVLQAEFTGSLQTDPKLLSTPQGVVKFVSFVPGAVGYVTAGEVSESVKVVKVDGRLPGQPGYKFNPGSH